MQEYVKTIYVIIQLKLINIKALKRINIRYLKRISHEIKLKDLKRVSYEIKLKVQNLCEFRVKILSLLFASYNVNDAIFVILIQLKYSYLTQI